MTTIASVSGVILVSCKDNACKNIIEIAKSRINGVTSAFRVEKKDSDSPDVIINIDAESKEQLLTVKDNVLNMKGVDKIKYRIT